jgi:hypothetical protein
MAITPIEEESKRIRTHAIDAAFLRLGGVVAKQAWDAVKRRGGWRVNPSDHQKAESIRNPFASLLPTLAADSFMCRGSRHIPA